MSLSVCLSVCLSGCLCIYLSVYPSSYQSTYLSVFFLSRSLSLYRSQYLPLFDLPLSMCHGPNLGFTVTLYLSLYCSISIKLCRCFARRCFAIRAHPRRQNVQPPLGLEFLEVVLTKVWGRRHESLWDFYLIDWEFDMDFRMQFEA